MHASISASPEVQHRQAARALARQLLIDPSNPVIHAGRVSAARDTMSGELAQGVLADLFAGADANNWTLKQSAVNRLRHLLPPLVVDQFDNLITGPELPRISRLATRWSVLCTPSYDTPIRARRSNPDASRALAVVAVQAVTDNDLVAQQDFLEHCIACNDTLAFMLTRRELERSGMALPAAWQLAFEGMLVMVDAQ